ncbi:two-component regulator propeller domain-containing protein [uncultured Hymenobacter sp.]|uniref:two-component regulator propeller domain-containing protein n=1 Tax=uncultured Hymenobacter sp. TaxID=170016 RepID=UPI0035C98627
MKRNALLLLAYFGLTLSAFSQGYVFNHLSVDEGLSNNTVLSICQDSRGFMWFGTYHGLNKYDGYRITSYLSNSQDSQAISDNIVTCLHEDRAQNLWVGTHLGGLNRYDRARDAFVRYTQESKPPYHLSANKIECILEDSQGNLWVGTDYGLNLLDRATGAFRAFYARPGDSTSLNSNQIYSITENDEHEILVLTNVEGLNRYNPRTGSFTRQALRPPWPHAKLARILTQDARQQYWVGTWEQGLLRFGPGGQLHHYQHQPGQPQSLSHNQVRAILQTRPGALWVGTDGGGLNLYNPARDNFTHLLTDEANPGSLSSNAVYSLYEDRAGIIWVGTFGGGVNFYSQYKAKFTHFTHLPHTSNSLSHKSVLAVLQDAGGSIWLGTDGGGLDLFDPVRQTFRHFRHNPADPTSLASNVVKSLYEDSRGNLWVGTYQGGLDRYDRARDAFVHYATDSSRASSLTTNSVWALYEDRHQQLWVSTLGGGLCRMDLNKEGVFTRFQPRTGVGALGDYNVVTMREDSAGNFWVGTEDRGLNLYQPRSQTFSYVQHDARNPKSLSSNRIQVIFEDSRKRLWVGTADGGLNLLNPRTRTFRHFTTADGLPSNVINAIVEDRAGNLWLSTNKGISRFDVEHRTFKNFDREDGLQSNEFNINSALRARDGSLYLGGINGFNGFSPTVLLRNPNVAPVVLTDVQVFNTSLRPGAAGSPLRQHISEAKTLTLPYKAAAVTFEFAALNFIDPQKNQYAYQLVGFDDAWRYAGTRREATYTNLDPGRYEFQVKAANNDGVWSAHATTLTVIITPPWWKTFWFRGLAALVGLSAATAFYLLRTNALRKKLQLEKLLELRTKEAELREARLQHEKALAELSKTQLETEVQHKNSELATSVIGMVQQNETLLSIRDSVKEALDDTDAAQQRRKMQRVVRVIEKNIDPSQHWQHFEALFNQLHENFMQRLKEQYPQLTSRDLKLCAYLRMNLDSKEIASLMGLSVRGAEDLRYRVRKKMQLDTTTNLAEFILLM